MEKLEQTISSVEVAEMIGKDNVRNNTYKIHNILPEKDKRGEMMKFKMACIVIGTLYMFGTVGSFVDGESLSLPVACLLGVAGAMLLFAGIRKDK